LVLSRFFGNRRAGFYVDVGCHHPHRFSNTFLLYRRGWQGICIDPLPGTAALFKRWRPRDIALEIGVSRNPGTLTYFMFNEPALNTFDADLAASRDGRDSYAIVERRSVPTDTLGAILERHLPADQPRIDLLSIDVEGLDLEVLKSNDWQRHRPSVIIAESLGSSLESLAGDPVAGLLKSLDYCAYAKTGQSIVFIQEPG
jgi:FkbM family methyltransferase